ncbi:MAG: SUF system Fe-S cluster assembly protein [Rhodothermales bacterium]
METPVENELEKRIIDAMKEVFGPEIPVNIYDLGLIYDINIYPDQTVHVMMTLTAPGCPVADTLPREVEESIRNVEGITDARVELTFDPPYTMEMMSEEAKFELGFL